MHNELLKDCKEFGNRGCRCSEKEYLLEVDGNKMKLFRWEVK